MGGMGDAEAQRYWDANAGAVTFSHPLPFDWLTELPKQARILDFGCGYGRTLAELRDAGWRCCVGVDRSREMIARGHRDHPQLDLRHSTQTQLSEPDGAFDAAILFAVLTTIPDDAQQLAVMAELARLLKPGGLLLVSDVGLQQDARHAERYRRGFERHGVYGVWDREDGGVFRHHSAERLATLLQRFDVIAERNLETRTMSGGVVTAIQILGRRR